MGRRKKARRQAFPKELRKKLREGLEEALRKAQRGVPTEIEEDPEWIGICARIEEDEGLTYEEAWRQEAAFLFVALRTETILSDTWRAQAKTLETFLIPGQRAKAGCVALGSKPEIVRRRTQENPARGKAPLSTCSEEGGRSSRPALRLIRNSDRR